MSLITPIFSLAVIVLSSPAWAYTVKETDTGVPLFWEETNLSFALVADGDPGVDDLDEVVIGAIAAWDSMEGSSLRIEFAGRTTGAHLGYDRTTVNQNLIVVLNEDWEFGSRTLAHTIVTWRASTGVLLDADIAVNGAQDWGDGNTAERFDLKHAASTATSKVFFIVSSLRPWLNRRAAYSVTPQRKRHARTFS